MIENFQSAENRMKLSKWILVTGAPRSGTTFVGKVLSAPLEIDYIHEPFNPDCGVSGIDRNFLFIGKMDEQSMPYVKIIERIFQYDFVLQTGYFKNDSALKKKIKQLVGSRGPIYLRLAKLNPFHKAAVIKDPSGCLLTEYLARNHGVHPVILVRHPIAFAASAKRLNWNPDGQLSLRGIREQREVVEQYFPGEEDSIYSQRKDVFEAAAVFWRTLNKIILIQCERNPHWHIITHEALCQKPIEYFRMLYTSFDLPWSSRIERLIFRLTNTSNKVVAREGRGQDFKRYSARLFEHSIKSLDVDQRRVIYDLTKDVALKIYTKESFHLDH